MKPFLTIEQRDWLIKRLKEELFILELDAPDSVSLNDIAEILNQCTEQAQTIEASQKLVNDGFGL
jgi:hypothetical protein